MKPLKPSETQAIAGGKHAPEMIDGPTFPLVPEDPPPTAEALPAELNPDMTVL
jgi:hypothetical protein